MIRPGLLACLALLAACGASHAPSLAPHAPPPAPPTAPPSRSLAPDATFGDLVDLARALDAAGAAGSARNCLLSWSSFDADLTVPLRPLPPAWTDATTTLDAHPGHVFVFTTFGPRGTDADITVVPFTRMLAPSPTLGIAVLFLTVRGVWARTDYEPGEDEVADETAGAVRIADLPDGLPLLARPLAAILVTADADVPLTRLRALLSRLAPLHPPVALAVPLRAGTVLDRAPVASGDLAASCPHGLVPPAADTGEGNIPATAGAALFASYASAAASCARRNAVTTPGDLTVDFRVASDGTVPFACAQLDTLGSAALRRCILDAVRGSHFPQPSPTGHVLDLAYSFRSTRNGASDMQSPLCVER